MVSKIIKQVWGLMLSVVVVVSMLPAGMVKGAEVDNNSYEIEAITERISEAEGPIDKWDGTADITWYQENPEANHYEISTAEQLAGLSELVADRVSFKGITVELISNIDLAGITWKPIGVYRDGYDGSFEGSGHIIKNLRVEQLRGDPAGLFGRISEMESVISNVGIVDCDIDGSKYTGGILGEVYSNGISEITNITNCFVTGNIKGGYYTGGVCGNGGKLDRCLFEGNVEGSSAVGGIVGYSKGLNNSQVAGCVVGTFKTGGIAGIAVNEFDNNSCTASVQGGGYTGGIAGQWQGSELKNISSSQDVMGSYNVGGIVGYGDGIIRNCSMSGYIKQIVTESTSSREECIGGICGGGSGSIQDCNVSAKFECDTAEELGGIVGILYGQGDIRNCYAISDIKGDGEVGGLVGCDAGAGEIRNCYATGTIEGREQVGGLVGQGGDRVIIDCYATGNVTASSYAGGLVGYTYRATHIETSYATGDVCGTKYVGGLMGAHGWYKSNSQQIKYCYATGDVKGADEVGGLVGTMFEDEALGNITCCYATGNVTATNRCVGGLIGSASGAEIKSSYALGDVTSTKVYELSTSELYRGTGGLIGNADNCSISSCYAVGDVKGNIMLGGLGGIVTGKVQNSIAIGAVSGATYQYKAGQYMLYVAPSYWMNYYKVGDPVGISGSIGCPGASVIYFNDVKATNCYSSETTYKDYFATAMSSKDLKTEWALNVLNDDTEAFALSSAYNNGYPYLAELEYEHMVAGLSEGIPIANNSITVIDGDTGIPISGANVSVGTEEYITDEIGMVSGTWIQVSDVVIQKEGYTDYDKKVLFSGENQNITLWKENSINAVNEVNVTYDGRTSNVLEQEMLVYLDNKSQNVVMTPVSQNENVEAFEILQNGEVVETISAGTTATIDVDDLVENKAIFVRTVLKNEKKGQGIELKIVAKQSELYGDENHELNLKIGDGFQVELPDNLPPPLGGSKINLNLWEVASYAAFDTSDGKIKIGIGIDIRENEEKEKFQKLQKIFKETQTDKKGYAGVVDRLESANYKVTGKNFASKALDAEFESSVIGYLIIDPETGDTSGEIVLEVKAKNLLGYRKVFPTSAGPISVYYTVGAEEKSVSDISLSSWGSLDVEISRVDIVFPKIKIGAGYGIKDLAYGGVFGEAEVKWITEKTKTGGVVSGYIGYEVEALYVFEMEGDFSWVGGNTDWGHFNIPFGETSVLSADRQQVPQRMNAMKVPTELETKDVSNYSTIDQWNSAVNARSVMRDEVSVIQENMAGDSKVQMVEAQNIKVMTWLDVEASDSSVNGVALYYAVYDESSQSWGEAIKVDDDGTMDGYPMLYSDGTQIVVAWQNSSDVVENTDISLSDIMRKGDISVSKFDFATNTFAEKIEITNNDVMDTYPSIAINGETLYVTWLANTESDIMGQLGTNSIEYAEIDDSNTVINARQLVKELPPMKELVSGQVGAGICAVIVDEGTVESPNRQVMIIDKEGNTKNVSEGGGVSNISIQNQNTLYWIQDEMLMANDGKGTSTIYAELGNAVGDYRIFQSEGTSKVLYIGSGQESTDVYESSFVDGKWIAPGQLSSTEKNIETISGVYDESGVYHFLGSQRTQMSEETLGDVRQRDMIELHLTEKADAMIESIAVDNDVLDISVKNNGVKEISALTISGSIDSEEVFKKEVNTTISQGDAEDYSVEMDLSAYDTEQLMNIEISTNEADLIYDNNLAEVYVQRSNIDMTVELVQYPETVNSEVTLINRGKNKMNGVLNVYHQDEIINTVNVQDVQGGQYVVANFSVLMDELTYDDNHQGVLTYEFVSDNPLLDGTSTIRDTMGIDQFVSYVDGLKGDVNLDGEVNIIDALRLCEHINKVDILPDEQFRQADLNENGIIEVTDVLRLYEHINGSVPFE